MERRKRVEAASPRRHRGVTAAGAHEQRVGRAFARRRRRAGRCAQRCLSVTICAGSPPESTEYACGAGKSACERRPNGGGNPTAKQRTDQTNKATTDKQRNRRAKSQRDGAPPRRTAPHRTARRRSHARVDPTLRVNLLRRAVQQRLGRRVHALHLVVHHPLRLSARQAPAVRRGNARPNALYIAQPR